ncbi:ABC transporter ATP-binding protein [Roseovarius aestuarii]|nr:ABC transporter ATP-binding protein [Roseovarius aestuarii]
MSTPLFEIDKLSLQYHTNGGAFHALRDVSLTARRGEVIGIVGESGSGKSTLVSAMIGLLSANAYITNGSVKINDTDLLTLSERKRRRFRGHDIAVIFQDPMTAFNPVLPLGAQLIDFQFHRRGVSKRDKRQHAIDTLTHVGIAAADKIMAKYVHELSGGMRQRAAIAAALVMTPDVLIADEPTTALDVTMEAQIIHLLRQLSHDHDGTIIVVTHHLGVIGELCDRVYVMYAGQVVEEGPVDAIYHTPGHPYTTALIDCDLVHLDETPRTLPTIPGRVPDLAPPPAGCAFANRCEKAQTRCFASAPPRVQIAKEHAAWCFRVPGHEVAQ